MHLGDALFESHMPRAGSICATEALAAADNLDYCYPTLVTLHELQAGPLPPTALRNIRGMREGGSYKGFPVPSMRHL